jgi:hypothetical protein
MNWLSCTRSLKPETKQPTAIPRDFCKEEPSKRTNLLEDNHNHNKLRKITPSFESNFPKNPQHPNTCNQLNWPHCRPVLKGCTFPNRKRWYWQLKTLLYNCDN